LRRAQPRGVSPEPARVSPSRRKHRAPKRGTSKRGKSRREAGGARAKKRRVARLKKSRTVEKAAKKTKRTEPNVSSIAKTTLRAKMRTARTRLSRDERRLAAERVVANLTASRLFLVSRRIACYLPADGEIDTSDIIERMWRVRKTVFLPVLSRMRHDRLWFAPAAPGMELAPNRFGIPEPKVVARDRVRAQEIDLILLPLVAFDAQGNRVGRGVGFYDRSLGFLRHRRHLRKPHLLGLAYDFQRVAKIDPDPWDVALDGVVTDRAVYFASP
jgi:5-formyltetrahydrofolate cyclo-ligase